MAITPAFQAQITALEERLRCAMQASDGQALDELLAPELMFTNHLGQLLSKVDDLALHRSGLLKFQGIELSALQMQPIGECVAVSVLARLSGSYALAPFETRLRFTRIWRQSAEGTWQVVLGHSSAVQD